MEAAVEKIQLRISNHKAYVWDIEDIKKLRTQHRICGILTGALPHLVQQNIFLGVPLLLMPEEVVLLVEKEIAVLIDDKYAHHQPSKLQQEEWNEARKIEHQREIQIKEGRAGDIAARKSLSEEAILRRRQREERRTALLAKTTEESETTTNMPEVSRPSTPVSVAGGSSIPYTVTIPTSSRRLDWYYPKEHVYHTIATARSAGFWSFPLTSEERARCGIFRALWEKGYYMGCGIKFGGEYLVYPGDPLRYHSHFVATVLDSHSSPIRPMEIVAHGRLGTATKKAHLLCSWDEQTEEAEIFSVEWAGFG